MLRTPILMLAVSILLLGCGVFGSHNSDSINGKPQPKGYIVTDIPLEKDYTYALSDTNLSNDGEKLFGGFSDYQFGSRYNDPGHITILMKPTDDVQILFYNFDGKFVARVKMDKVNIEKEIKINIDDIFDYTNSKKLLFIVLKNGKPIIRYHTLFIYLDRWG